MNTLEVSSRFEAMSVGEVRIIVAHRIMCERVLSYRAFKFKSSSFVHIS